MSSQQEFYHRTPQQYYQPHQHAGIDSRNINVNGGFETLQSAIQYEGMSQHSHALLGGFVGKHRSILTLAV